MKFSLILPTRDRPALFQRSIESIWTHTKHKNDIEGLRNHLIELGIMNKNQTLIMGQ